MANEAVIIELHGDAGDVTRYTVASGAAILKGTLCILSDIRTATASSAASGKFIGIAATDKSATDNSTNLGLFTNGIFDIITPTTAGAEGAIQAGDLVEISGANMVRRLSGAAVYNGVARAAGRALETATTAEVIAVKIGGFF